MHRNRETQEYMYPIDGYDNYAVSRSGQVCKIIKKPGYGSLDQDYTVLKQHVLNGTPYVNLVNLDGSKKFAVAGAINTKSAKSASATWAT